MNWRDWFRPKPKAVRGWWCLGCDVVWVSNVPPPGVHLDHDLSHFADFYYHIIYKADVRNGFDFGGHVTCGPVEVSEKRA